MRISWIIGLGLLLVAQGDGSSLQSGPKVGEILPGPIDAFNINGKNAEGRQHCLVCEYGLNPVAAVFAREPADGKDSTLTSLLTKLDDAVSRHKDDQGLGSFAIFLSPDGRNSVYNPGEKDPSKIVEEELARTALVKRLKERADKLKNVVVAFYPEEGPKDYHFNPKAEVTVLFYQKQKVLANFAFAPGKMTPADVDKIIETVDAAFKKR
jgi:hypothetical protein